MAAAVKGDELVPHPVKDQLTGVDYCVNSNPPWGTFSFFFCTF